MNVAIVVAGGKGTRLGGNRPKQFIELNAIPIIVHTLRQ
ncbi:MAG: 2-C-methyl-D-erythritol 4-phosphate cytidylyltransferase, partial [Acidobacteria bacterium]